MEFTECPECGGTNYDYSKEDKHMTHIKCKDCDYEFGPIPYKEACDFLRKIDPFTDLDELLGEDDTEEK